MYYIFFLFCSLVAAVPLEKRQEKSDVSLLVNNLKATVANLGKGVPTSDLSKAITDIIALADVIIASPGANADKSQVDEVISATIKTIKNHAKTGKLSSRMWELSRAIILLSDLANDFTLLADDEEKLYKAAVVVKATGQAILESIQFLGEDQISFDLSQREKIIESAGRVKRGCNGVSFWGICIGNTYGK
ncbi:unnamed protein product [Lymnaea stagnalis]|uniref:Uncharacterized protein n=1 Tax=Lymnaea stagnalis TaxID=6523 RepID=A0AAV2HEH5_LYMST